MRIDEETNDEQRELETAPPPPESPKRRGFAAMTPERVREIARKGGVATHASGKLRRFTSEEAREAGRKGGRAPHRARGKAARRAGGAP